MGERYFITGVQLGLLKSYVEWDMKGSALILIDEIIDKQFTGNVQPRPEVEEAEIKQYKQALAEEALRRMEVEKP